MAGIYPEPKKKVGIFVSEELHARISDRVSNFSAWVEDAMRAELALPETVFLRCPCKVGASAVVWKEKWNWVCPGCGTRRERAELQVEVKE